MYWIVLYSHLIKIGPHFKIHACTSNRTYSHHHCVIRLNSKKILLLISTDFRQSSCLFSSGLSLTDILINTEIEDEWRFYSNVRFSVYISNRNRIKIEYSSFLVHLPHFHRFQFQHCKSSLNRNKMQCATPRFSWISFVTTSLKLSSTTE